MSCRDICLKKINPGGDISRCRVPPVRKKNILNGSAAALKAEVEAYRVAARSAPAIDHRDVKAFTEAVLEFWRKSGNNMPVWRKAARIVLAIPPTSEASERVFSLLEAMFGKDQDASLSDLIQGSLMLRYNERRIG